MLKDWGRVKRHPLLLLPLVLLLLLLLMLLLLLLCTSLVSVLPPF